MTKEQKIIVHVELDPELLKKIDQEAEKDLRTRKAQVLYIIREYFNRNKLGLEKKKFIWDDLKFKKPWENIWENVEIMGIIIKTNQRKNDSNPVNNSCLFYWKALSIKNYKRVT